MFNVTILKIKDLAKYLIYILVAILAIKSLSKITFEKKMTKSLEETIPTVFKADEKIEKNFPNYKENISENNKIDFTKEIINSQISSIKEIQKEENIKSDTNEGNENKSPEQEEEKNTNDIPSNAKTEIVTQNPIQENFNVQYGKVKIKNGTDYTLTNEMMTPDIVIDNKNIVIFHTHTCESYTSSEAYQYTPTGSYRTTDLNYSVARVGTELETYLKKYNHNVYHDITYHDYPAYNGSYTRSLGTVLNILKANPADILIDLHRDAIGSRSDYAPIVKIGEDYAAQIMFVIGTDNGGLEHPNWNQNLKFAIKVQEKAEEMYPGLFKPIMLTKSRYNQHASKYANIIEVGATGNTLEQCLTSMKYLSKIIDEVVKQ